MHRREFVSILDRVHEGKDSIDKLLAYYQALEEYDHLTADILILLRLILEAFYEQKQEQERATGDEEEEESGEESKEGI